MTIHIQWQLLALLIILVAWLVRSETNPPASTSQPASTDPAWWRSCAG
jgi:hypothetical protein